jgi:hypothetical protein
MLVFLIKIWSWKVPNPWTTWSRRKASPRTGPRKSNKSEGLWKIGTYVKLTDWLVISRLKDLISRLKDLISRLKDLISRLKYLISRLKDWKTWFQDYLTWFQDYLTWFNFSEDMLQSVVSSENLKIRIWNMKMRNWKEPFLWTIPL